MRAYWRTFTSTLQRALIYRARILTFALTSTSLPLIMIIVWSKYYADGNSLPNFTYSQMVSYYLAVVLVKLLVSRVDVNVTEDVKDGKLANFVIKPFNYLLFRFFWEIAWYFIKVIVYLVPLFFIFFFLRNQLSFASWPNLGLSVLSILFSYLVSFTFSMNIGLLAFFLTETKGLVNLNMMTSELLTGTAFPLSLFPLWAQRILELTHFKYVVYFPAKALTGHYSCSQIIAGLGIQLSWVFVFSLVYLFAWRQGIKKFSAVGL